MISSSATFLALTPGAGLPIPTGMIRRAPSCYGHLPCTQPCLCFHPALCKHHKRARMQGWIACFSSPAAMTRHILGPGQLTLRQRLNSSGRCSPFAVFNDRVGALKRPELLCGCAAAPRRCTTLGWGRPRACWHPPSASPWTQCGGRCRCAPACTAARPTPWAASGAR